MPEPLNLFLSIVFGGIGFAFFIYGKKQAKFIPLIVGIILMIYPYFVSSALWIGIIGIGLSAIPLLF